MSLCRDAVLSSKRKNKQPWQKSSDFNNVFFRGVIADYCLGPGL